jgi:hypothetical protein
MNRNAVLWLVAACLWWCSGCATNKVESSWKSPALQGRPVQNICVVAVDDRKVVREAFESRFVLALRKHGKHANMTWETLALPEIKNDKEAAAAQMRAGGADAVLIVRLLDQATYVHQVYAPGVAAAVAASNGGDWYDCYAAAYSENSMIEGETEQDIYLDSSLFALDSGQRLWSAATLTRLMEDADRLAVADSLVAKLLKVMLKDGVVEP